MEPPGPLWKTLTRLRPNILAQLLDLLGSSYNYLLNLVPLCGLASPSEWMISVCHYYYG